MIRYILSAILVFTMAISIHAQQRHIDLGQRNFENLRYSEAIKHYELAIDKGADPIIYLKLAESYRMINQTETAALWFSRVPRDVEWPADAHFQYGLAAKTMQNFVLAKQQFLLYKKKGGDDKTALDALIASCDSASTWLTQSTGDSVWMDTWLSTDKGEFANTPWRDGFIMASNNFEKEDVKIDPWTGQPYYKLVYVDSQKTELLDARINKGLNVGPATRHKNTIYFTRTVLDRLTELNRLEIYESTYADGQWSLPIPFEHNDDQYSFGHPSISEDGRRLYYISDKPNGLGGFDIYSSDRKRDGWTEPKNLGPAINTPYDEVFPYVAPEGQLYFASKGHDGLGGLDIYTIQKNGPNSWGLLTNMRAPINTETDDFGIHFTGRNVGYISSARAKKGGLDDIYRFVLREPTCVKVLVFNQDNKQLRDVRLNVDCEDGGVERQFETELLEGEGIFCFQKPKDILLQVRKDGYEMSEVEVPNDSLFEGDTTIVRIIMRGDIMDEITKIELKNIYFDFDKSNILPKAAKELDKLVALMEKYPELEVKLEAHCDCRGSDAYNIRLSHRRAKSAVNYLVEHGIIKQRLEWEGFGEHRLRNQCADGVICAESEHDINRRVELRIKGVVPGREIIYRD